MNDEIMKTMGKVIPAIGDMFRAQAAGNCPFCGKSMKGESFKDAKSFKEFQISGICQPCQDGFFVEPTE